MKSYVSKSELEFQKELAECNNKLEEIKKTIAEFSLKFKFDNFEENNIQTLLDFLKIDLKIWKNSSTLAYKICFVFQQIYILTQIFNKDVDWYENKMKIIYKPEDSSKLNKWKTDLNETQENLYKIQDNLHHYFSTMIVQSKIPAWWPAAFNYSQAVDIRAKKPLDLEGYSNLKKLLAPSNWNTTGEIVAYQGFPSNSLFVPMSERILVNNFENDLDSILDSYKDFAIFSYMRATGKFSGNHAYFSRIDSFQRFITEKKFINNHLNSHMKKEFEEAASVIAINEDMNKVKNHNKAIFQYLDNLTERFPVRLVFLDFQVPQQSSVPRVTLQLKIQDAVEHLITPESPILQKWLKPDLESKKEIEEALHFLPNKMRNVFLYLRRCNYENWCSKRS